MCERLCQTAAKFILPTQFLVLGTFATIDVSDDNTKNNTSNGARGAKMIFPSRRGVGFKIN